MERFLIPSIFWGAVTGLVSGGLLLVPFIAPLIFFLIFILSGIAVIILLKRTPVTGIINIYDGCFIGAVAGFVTLFAASAVYLPITMLTGGFLSIKGYDILAVLIIVFSTAILSSVFNAFSGLITAYIYEKIETRNISFEDHFEITQADE